MDLSEQQVRYFDTFGYLMLPALFAPEEMAWIIEEFETAIQTVGGAGMFFPLMLDTADPPRQTHLEQPALLHDEIFPQFARTS